MTNILEDDTASSSKYIHNVYLNFAAKYKEHIGKSHFFFSFITIDLISIFFFWLMVVLLITSPILSSGLGVGFNWCASLGLLGVSEIIVVYGYYLEICIIGVVVCSTAIVLVNLLKIIFKNFEDLSMLDVIFSYIYSNSVYLTL